MAKITGFLEHDRRDRSYYSVKERIKGFKEFLVPLNNDGLRTDFIPMGGLEFSF